MLQSIIIHCETLSMPCEECDIDAGQLRALALSGGHDPKWLEDAFSLANMIQGLTYLDFNCHPVPLSLLGRCASVRAVSCIRLALACTIL